MKLEYTDEELLGGSVIAWESKLEIGTSEELKDWSQFVV